jgi:hypothetical protein
MSVIRWKLPAKDDSIQFVIVALSLLEQEKSRGDPTYIPASVVREEAVADDEALTLLEHRGRSGDRAGTYRRQEVAFQLNGGQTFPVVQGGDHGMGDSFVRQGYHQTALQLARTL